MLVVLMLGLMTWIAYGLLRKDLPIVATNAFSLLLNIAMMVLRLKYNRKRSEKPTPPPDQEGSSPVEGANGLQQAPAAVAVSLGATTGDNRKAEGDHPIAETRP